MPALGRLVIRVYRIANPSLLFGCLMFTALGLIGSLGMEVFHLSRWAFDLSQPFSDMPTKWFGVAILFALVALRVLALVLSASDEESALTVEMTTPSTY